MSAALETQLRAGLAQLPLSLSDAQVAQLMAFLDLLQQAVAVKEAPGSPLALSNEVMRRRARWLIETADDLF